MFVKMQEVLDIIQITEYNKLMESEGVQWNF